MRIRRLGKTAFTLLSLAAVVLLASTSGSAQRLAKSITIQATAMGTSTQMGQRYDITLIIQEFSPPEDQKVLLAVFAEKGNEGLINALYKMESKGRMSITGTLGYDVSYIRKWKDPDGTVRLRVITNRPIRFGEAWRDDRSSDYELSGIDLVLSRDKKKNSGTLLPRAKLKMNKQNQLEVELYQNPWNLVNIQQRSGAPLL